MYQIVNATYNNNTLNLNDKVELSNGKKVKIIIINEDERKLSNFLKFIDKQNFILPKDYKFVRDELYDR